VVAHPDERLADGLEASVDGSGLRDDRAGERGGGRIAGPRRVRGGDTDRADHDLEEGGARHSDDVPTAVGEGLVDVVNLEGGAPRARELPDNPVVPGVPADPDQADRTEVTTEARIRGGAHRVE